MNIRKYLETVLKIQVKEASKDELLGHCPHPDHDDRNASWYINSQSGLFKCHSCGFKGSLRILSKVVLGEWHGNYVYQKISGDDLSEEGRVKSLIASIQTDPPPEQTTEFQESSWEYYKKEFYRGPYLDEKIASKIKFYLTTPLIKKYNLRHWTTNGYLYNRIAIPITDNHGNLVNIQFRRLVESEEHKYKTLPKGCSITELSKSIFNPESLLSDSPKTYDVFRDKKLYTFITESTLDTIYLSNLGFNSVSTFTNDITYEQMLLIKQITDFPIIFFDFDKYGYKKQLSNFFKYKNILNISQITLCYGKDPDEYNKEEISHELNRILRTRGPG